SESHADDEARDGTRHEEGRVRNSVGLRSLAPSEVRVRSQARMSGRGHGLGKLVRTKNRKGQTVYRGDWVGSDGKRHRKHRGTDKRAAEQQLAALVRTRDLAARGMALEETQEQRLRDVLDRWRAEVRATRSAKYADLIDESVKRFCHALGAIRVRDLSVER